jgi:hypothetical protein
MEPLYRGRYMRMITIMYSEIREEARSRRWKVRNI